MIRFGKKRSMLMGLIVLGAIAVLLWPAKPLRPVTKMEPAGSLRIDDITVVDPRDGSLKQGMSVDIVAGRITRVGTSNQLPSDPSVQRVDGRGKFVVPGFNNMHYHAIDADDPSGDLALMLAEGVTGFRQMSGSDRLLKERRESRLPLTRYSPQLLAMPGEVLTPFNAGSPDAAKAEIHKQKAEGADFIKVGLVSPEVYWAVLNEVRKVGLPVVGHLQVGVDPVRAAREGFRSVEHLGPGAPIWIACSKNSGPLFAEAALHPAMKAPPFKIPFLEAFIQWRLEKILINPAAFADPDDIARLQHAFDSYDPEQCKTLTNLFRANNTWHVPTLVRLRTQELPDDPAYQSDPFLRYMPQESIDRWQEVLERFKALPAPMLATLHSAYDQNLALTKFLSDAGVPLMAGTDGGGLAMPGMMLQAEFGELARAGIAPLKILQMTTTNPAIFLGRADSMGLVSEGYEADLVLLDANPLASVSNLHRIAGVVRAGHYHSAADLRILRERVARGRGFLK